MPTTYRYPYRPAGWATDIYPMPAFAQLVVADAARSSAWYQQVLGFADVFTARADDGATLVAHLRWCTFGDVLLVPTRATLPATRGTGVTLYFSAEDVDAIAAHAATHGVLPIDGPVERPWNTREATFADPDGYRLTFAAPTAAALARAATGTFESMDDVVNRMRSVFRS